MVFVRGSMTELILATLAVALGLKACEAFGVGPGVVTAGRTNALHTGSVSSFFRAVTSGKGGRRTGESSTSLWSAYSIKPGLARSQGSQWRKLRTRGPGFGEKVCYSAISESVPLSYRLNRVQEISSFPLKCYGSNTCFLPIKRARIVAPG